MWTAPGSQNVMQTCCQVPEKMGKRSLRELERQADDDLSYDDETIVAPVTPKKRKVASKEENQKVPRVKRRRQGERVDDIPANQQGGEAASLEKYVFIICGKVPSTSVCCSIIRQALTSKDRKMLDDALTSSDLLGMFVLPPIFLHYPIRSDSTNNFRSCDSVCRASTSSISFQSIIVSFQNSYHVCQYRWVRFTIMD